MCRSMYADVGVCRRVHVYMHVYVRMREYAIVGGCICVYAYAVGVCRCMYVGVGMCMYMYICRCINRL